MFLIEPHYLPLVPYFALLQKHSEAVLDDISLFKKQSYRNRTCILSANGKLNLVVPVKQGKTHTPFKDVRIDYSTNWQQLHLATIRSAYGKAPFFIHFFDELEAGIKKNRTYLLDLNISLIEILIRQSGMNAKIRLLSSVKTDLTDVDLRDCFHPKPKYHSPPATVWHIRYMQTFSDRFNFVPGLSFIDLLFNEGPEAQGILLQMTS